MEDKIYVQGRDILLYVFTPLSAILYSGKEELNR